MASPHGWRPGAPDGVTAIVVSGFVLIGALVAPPGRTDLDLFGYALLLGGSLSLVALRRAPRAVLLFVTFCVVGYFLRGYPGVIAAVPLMVALFVAVKTGNQRFAVAPLAALLIVTASDLLIVGGRPAREIIEDRFLLAGWIVASAMMGAAFRQWGAFVREAEQRAADAERTREEVAARRAGEERLRIARDLHDSLTHSISIINVQTGVAVHLARKRGEQVPEALLTVQQASGEAMRELRATLGVLRGGDSAVNGLHRLDDLVESARTAGLRAVVTVGGTRRALPPEVDQAAFRIVQEALTNVARHAGAAVAEVSVDYGREALVVRIEDNGRATPDLAPVPGIGLIGMRERVTALGGTLRAEPRSEGGFRVRAEFPLEAAVPSGPAADLVRAIGDPS